MNEYLRKRGKISQSEELFRSVSSGLKKEQLGEPLKKVKRIEVLESQILTELKQVKKSIENLQHHVNSLKNLKNQSLLVETPCQKPQIKTNIFERISPISNPIIQQIKKLEVTKGMDTRRKSLYIRAPNQIPDGKLSQSGQSNGLDGQFIPKL